MGCMKSKPEEGNASSAGMDTKMGTTNPLGLKLEGAIKLSDFNLGQKLGAGQYAEVFKVTHKGNNATYALKCMDKSKMSEEEITGLSQEIAILGECDHPNVMNLYGSFEEKGKVYLVTELLAGGELFDRIVEKEPPHYSEKTAASAVRLILEAIAYLHSKGVAHRDLKPENLILVSKDDDKSAKIADFGFAAKPALRPGGFLTDGVGTPGYVAPEIISPPRRHGLPCDIWSLGVIVYILICGYPPFYHDDDRKLFKIIQKGKYQYDKDDWANVSNECKDFIDKMLIVDVKKRWTADQLLQHSWMTSADVSDEHRDAALASLKSWKAKQRWKKAGNAVKATVRMKKFLELAQELTREDE